MIFDILSSYIISVFLIQMQNFTKELQDLKQLQASTPWIDNEEDMATLKIFALNLHNFQNDISETMQVSQIRNYFSRTFK